MYEKRVIVRFVYPISFPS